MAEWLQEVSSVNSVIATLYIRQDLSDTVQPHIHTSNSSELNGNPDLRTHKLTAHCQHLRLITYPESNHLHKVPATNSTTISRINPKDLKLLLCPIPLIAKPPSIRHRDPNRYEQHKRHYLTKPPVPSCIRLSHALS